MKARQHTLLWVALTLSALMLSTSCGTDRHAATAENFARIAHSNFDEEKAKSSNRGHYDLDFNTLSDGMLFPDGKIPQGFPVVITANKNVLDRVSKREKTQEPELITALNEMVRLGFVTSTPTTLNEEKVTTYSLTKSGEKLFGKKPTMKVDVGEWVFDEYLGSTTVRDSATSDGLDFKRSKVSYSYKLKSIPQWVEDSKVLKELFKVPDGVYLDHFNLYYFEGSNGWSTSDRAKAFSKPFDPLNSFERDEILHTPVN